MNVLNVEERNKIGPDTFIVIQLDFMLFISYDLNNILCIFCIFVHLFRIPIHKCIYFDNRFQI
jgi:hypothetical protein